MPPGIGSVVCMSKGDNIGASWRAGMAEAYRVGTEHGEKRFKDHFAARGFDACYWQGWGHGAGSCGCPDRLAGKYRDGRVCVCCGQRRWPQ